VSNPVHTVEYEIQESWVRFGTVAWSYVDIAQNAYSLYLCDEAERLPRPSEEESGEDYYAQQRRLFQNAVKTVVFSAMALEAAIFDFAAIHLGDRYASETLDKLDTLQKWLVAPRLVCGRALKEASPGINALRTVIRARNALVHAKSLPATRDHSNIKKTTERQVQLERDVHECFKCVVLLSLELNSLLGTVAGVLPPFEKIFIPTTDTLLPIGLLPVIERARQIHARSEA
jgi:hypothetical protein